MTKYREIHIRKASGEDELFSPDKLRRSLEYAGAENDTIREIIEDIEHWISPGVTTRDIYDRAFEILRNVSSNSSFRYRLKQAIFEIGPNGHPFEILIGELFKCMGYKTQVGIVLEGQFITHEMDVVATLNKRQHLVECKYHKDQGNHVSVQVPLYVRSRVNDIINKREELPEYKGFTFEGWVVTNTSFSPDSINYGTGSGLNLLAWNYPEGNGLKENIEKYKLYPITILRNLNSKEKQFLLDHGIVTCSQLLDKADVLYNIEPNKVKRDRLLKEIRDIMG